MTQLSKFFRLLCLCISAAASNASAVSSHVPVVENVLRNQFPTQPVALANTTEDLLQEYKHTGNVTSLIFYAYGMLKQADYFKTVNDIINASEYAKTGFFYLDEAVDLNEKDPRVRYLRARVDAYLPANLGRCVITVSDADLLLSENNKFSARLISNINAMNYRSLINCGETNLASQFLQKIKASDEGAEIDIASDNTPPWDMDEVTNIIVPLVKGE